MKTVYISSECVTHTRSAQTMSELKAIVLNEFDIRDKGWTYTSEEKQIPQTFRQFFKNADKGE